MTWRAMATGVKICCAGLIHNRVMLSIFKISRIIFLSLINIQAYSPMVSIFIHYLDLWDFISGNTTKQ